MEFVVKISKTSIKKEETWIEEFYPFVGLTHGNYLYGTLLILVIM